MSLLVKYWVEAGNFCLDVRYSKNGLMSPFHEFIGVAETKLYVFCSAPAWMVVPYHSSQVWPSIVAESILVPMGWIVP